MSLKTWLNESPGAAAIEAQEESDAELASIRPLSFDPRTEVSADAKYIVHHLTWNIVLIFIVLPIVFGTIVWVLSH